MEHFYAVIMAGGGGTRLWPLSRQSRPKQMLALNGQHTLFQMAVNRLEGLFSPEQIYVVTVAGQAPDLQKQAPSIPVENYLLEPMPRGTASVVGLAAVALQARDPQATMAILTADHFINDEVEFRQTLVAAYEVAQAGYLVTLAIPPTHPSTGYGYVQRASPLTEFQTRPVYRVEKFKEKPKEEQAREFIRRGDHDWNSGMFIWRVERILEEFARWMPDLMIKLETIKNVWNGRNRAEVIQSVWPTIHPETIDYGIMEHAEQVATVPSSGLGWNDVGSWDSLFDVLPVDENGNIIVGARHLGLDTGNSLVVGEAGDRLIVTIGMENLVVIDTGNALLICPRDQAQKVKDVVSALKNAGQSEYL